jgi:Zn-dependent protease with chaperone function
MATLQQRGPALAPITGSSGIEGIPAEYNDGRDWLRQGLRRQPGSVVIALVLGWTGTWFAFWGAAIGAVLGILVAAGATSSGLGLGIGTGIGPLAVIAGLFLGAIFGFGFVLYWIFYTSPWQPLAAIALGFIVAAILMIAMAAYERLWLRMRGYRRLTRDEVRKVAPLVRDSAERMNLEGLPRFAIADLQIPNAWAHMRTIVLTTGLLEALTPDELQAIITHELYHWRSGDAVGSWMIWCAAFPIAITVNVGRWLSGSPAKSELGKSIPGGVRKGFAYVLGWLIAWPGWLILRYIIRPSLAAASRQQEYEADAAAAALGLAARLRAALTKMGAFESGRTGWEQAMYASHPPMALRIEALQEPKPDDPVYQEDELRGPSRGEVFRLLTPFVPRRFGRGNAAAG